jgi:hypothetical protein
VPSISGWAEANIGSLNIYINSCYSISGANFSPVFGANESGIYMEMYNVKHYESQIRLAVNGIATPSSGISLDWVELRDGDSTIRRSNPADLARVYRGLKKDAQDELNNMIETYRANEANPSQITGDEWI